MVAYARARGQRGKPNIQAVVARVTDSGVHVTAMRVERIPRGKHVYLRIHPDMGKPHKVRVLWPARINRPGFWTEEPLERA